jgi:hypothetical protein
MLIILARNNNNLGNYDLIIFQQGIADNNFLAKL